jgi:hypothetical protein
MSFMQKRNVGQHVLVSAAKFPSATCFFVLPDKVKHVYCLRFQECENILCVYSYSSLPHEMSKASSSASSPHSAIHSYLLRIIAFSPSIKIIQ